MRGTAVAPAGGAPMSIGASGIAVTTNMGENIGVYGPGDRRESELRGALRRQRGRERHALEERRLVQDRPPARPGEQVPLPLVRREPGHDERLRRERRARCSGGGMGGAAGVVRGPEPRLPLPAHAHRRPGAEPARRREDRGQPLQDRGRRAGRQRLLAGDGHPARPVRGGAPDPRRGGEVRRGSRAGTGTPSCTGRRRARACSTSSRRGDGGRRRGAARPRRAARRGDRDRSRLTAGPRKGDRASVRSRPQTREASPVPLRRGGAREARPGRAGR